MFFDNDLLYTFSEGKYVLLYKSENDKKWRTGQSSDDKEYLEKVGKQHYTYKVITRKADIKRR
jgi:hypothetical protein